MLSLTFPLSLLTLSLLVAHVPTVVAHAVAAHHLDSTVAFASCARDARRALLLVQGASGDTVPRRPPDAEWGQVGREWGQVAAHEAVDKAEADPHAEVATAQPVQAEARAEVIPDAEEDAVVDVGPVDVAS